jgi:hypothetical protein
VNLSSTSTVDAVIMGRPVVNLDFDPQPGGRDHHLVKDVNHLWTHFRPVAASGGIWLVNTMDETVAAVRAYLSRRPNCTKKAAVGLHTTSVNTWTDVVASALPAQCSTSRTQPSVAFRSIVPAKFGA